VLACPLPAACWAAKSSPGQAPVKPSSSRNRAPTPAQADCSSPPQPSLEPPLNPPLILAWLGSSAPAHFKPTSSPLQAHFKPTSSPLQARFKLAQAASSRPQVPRAAAAGCRACRLAAGSAGACTLQPLCHGRGPARPGALPSVAFLFWEGMYAFVNIRPRASVAVWGLLPPCGCRCCCPVQCRRSAAGELPAAAARCAAAASSHASAKDFKLSDYLRRRGAMAALGCPGS